MHYLILGKNGQRREQMAKFLELIRIKVPMDQAFQQAFQTTFETMERELREYIRQDRYPVVDAHFEKKLQLDNDMMSATVSEAEVQAYLGDLLLHSNRSESEAYLQRALALDPNLAMAHAAMGMLRVREGKTDEAHKSLERAAAANSQNYLIHYYYAYALSREGAVGSELVSTFTPETAAKIREELRKAIELRPDFPESYNLLAFVSLVTGTQLDESIAELKRAQHTSPGRNDFTYMLAQIYLHKEDYKTSRQLLEQLNNANVDEELRQRAQGLLRQVAAIEEQKARIQSVRNSVVTDNPSMVQTPYDPSSELRAVLRKPADGENQLQAMLVRIECDAKGIVFVVDAGGDRLLRLKTDRFEHVSITTYSTDASGELTCGPRKPENAVVVSFIPSSDADTKPIITRPRSANSRLKASDTNARIDGLLRALEFVPKDFKLKADK
jgi:tetratricopeptide (TPR) repeat protein